MTLSLRAIHRKLTWKKWTLWGPSQLVIDGIRVGRWQWRETALQEILVLLWKEPVSTEIMDSVLYHRFHILILIYVNNIGEVT